MKDIISILMHRDGLTRQQAQEAFDEAKEAIFEAIDDDHDPEEVLADLLGLEPDYIFEFFA